MAEGGSDESEKTEEPTDKKKKDARDKGDVAVSREVVNAAMLGTATLVLIAAGGFVASGVATPLAAVLGRAEQLPVDEGGLRQLLLALLGAMAPALAVPLGALCVAALASHLGQTGLTVSAEQMKPKLDKLSPMKGFGRLFGGKAWVEFLKNCAKVTVVGVVAWLVLAPELGPIESWVAREPAETLTGLARLSRSLMVAVSIAVLAIAGLDLFWQRFQRQQRLKMSRQEIKEEHKQSEGDPYVKGRQRMIRMERARRRMMAAVPQATVVVTNPTHYAVALRYEPPAMAAPVVVAKGVDRVALRIREVAKEAGVPVVESPPLARALHAAVELDQPITPEHYKAAAEVISYVFELRRRTGRAGRR